MIGDDIYEFASGLFKLDRSITGQGLRDTLSKIRETLPPLKIHSFSTGTKIFDWNVPKEWKVIEAYIKTPSGRKICQFKENNLHLLGYSAPVSAKMSLADLDKHLYSIPEQPDAIPYVTSYYAKNWGFCISHKERMKLPEGQYEVVVDSKFFDGELNLGELILPGEKKDEIFFSTYVCHPSMANNELSGPAVLTYLAKYLMDCADRRYTYRFVFLPETIGSIAYLAKNYKTMKKRIIAGFNVTCVGDDRAYSFLPSKHGNTMSDQVAKHVISRLDPNYCEYSWSDRGSDERQYCSPGIDLPVSTVMRTKFGEFPEYHSSLDKFGSVVTAEGLEGGFEIVKLITEVLENNYYYKVKTLCEPNLGKHGLYPLVSTRKSKMHVQQTLDFISYCDGKNSVLDIADRLGIAFWELDELVSSLLNANIIEKENVVKKREVNAFSLLPNT